MDCCRAKPEELPGGMGAPMFFIFADTSDQLAGGCVIYDVTRAEPVARHQGTI